MAASILVCASCVLHICFAYFIPNILVSVLRSAHLPLLTFKHAPQTSLKALRMLIDNRQTLARRHRILEQGQLSLSPRERQEPDLAHATYPPPAFAHVRKDGLVTQQPLLTQGRASTSKCILGNRLGLGAVSVLYKRT